MALNPLHRLISLIRDPIFVIPCPIYPGVYFLFYHPFYTSFSYFTSSPLVGFYMSTCTTYHYDNNEDIYGVSMLLFMNPVHMESTEFDIAEHRSDDFGPVKHLCQQPELVEIFAKVVQAMVDTAMGNNEDPP